MSKYEEYTAKAETYLAMAEAAWQRQRLIAMATVRIEVILKGMA